MATLHYSITFHGDWHCGSGMAAGAELDALVIKDGRGLPYIPGKTIKGLFREQAEMLIDCGCAHQSASLVTAHNGIFHLCL